MSTPDAPHPADRCRRPGRLRRHRTGVHHPGHPASRHRNAKHCQRPRAPSRIDRQRDERPAFPRVAGVSGGRIQRRSAPTSGNRGGTGVLHSPVRGVAALVVVSPSRMWRAAAAADLAVRGADHPGKERCIWHRVRSSPTNGQNLRGSDAARECPVLDLRHHGPRSGGVG